MEAELSIVQQQMMEEVVEGLRRPQKSLPSKFFYDERGSVLFEEITRQKEYYPTRTESEILCSHIDDIDRFMGPQPVLIELGSGSSAKTRLLLERLPDIAAYVPVDISETYLLKVVESLKEEYPELPIKPVCTDYTRSFLIPRINRPSGRQVAFYPGSTIGNFLPEEAAEFLQTIACILGKGGGLLIGVDRKKDPAILNAAYNDREGVTAAFNKNMLVRLNRELGANFQVDCFTHKAFYNEEEGRIEMHLVCGKDQQVRLNGEVIKIAQGESIHTENSYKYSPEDFKKMVSEWFTVQKVWTDEQKLFSVQYLTVK